MYTYFSVTLEDRRVQVHLTDQEINSETLDNALDFIDRMYPEHIRLWLTSYTETVEEWTETVEGFSVRHMSQRDYSRIKVEPTEEGYDLIVKMQAKDLKKTREKLKGVRETITAEHREYLKAFLKDLRDLAPGDPRIGLIEQELANSDT